MVVIYGIEESPPCRAVYLVAKAIGLDLEKRKVDLDGGEHKSPAYLQINPQGQVPALVDGDLKLGESRAIIAYLMNKYAPKSNLYPKDPAARALVDSLLYFDVGLFAVCRAVLYPMLFLKDAKQSNAFLPKLSETVKILEMYMDGSEYVAGDKLTIADLSILAAVSTLQEIQFDLSAFPKTKAWLAKLQEELPYYEQANGVGARSLGGIFLKNKKELEGK